MYMGGRWNQWCVACFRDGSEAWEARGEAGTGTPKPSTLNHKP